MVDLVCMDIGLFFFLVFLVLWRAKLVPDELALQGEASDGKTVICEGRTVI